eukprot:gene313-biopygen18092
MEAEDALLPQGRHVLQDGVAPRVVPAQPVTVTEWRVALPHHWASGACCYHARIRAIHGRGFHSAQPRPADVGIVAGCLRWQ